jgi:hypothetical protein
MASTDSAASFAAGHVAPGCSERGDPVWRSHDGFQGVGHSARVSGAARVCPGIITAACPRRGTTASLAPSANVGLDWQDVGCDTGGVVLPQVERTACASSSPMWGGLEQVVQSTLRRARYALCPGTAKPGPTVETLPCTPSKSQASGSQAFCDMAPFGAGKIA